MLIRLTGLISAQKFFWILHIAARLERLISIKTKEYFIWPPLWKRSIRMAVVCLSRRAINLPNNMKATMVTMVNWARTELGFQFHCNNKSNAGNPHEGREKRFFTVSRLILKWVRTELFQFHYNNKSNAGSLWLKSPWWSRKEIFYRSFG